jgi:hypothetical protein
LLREDACHDIGHVHGDVHFAACRHQSDRDFLRRDRPHRHARHVYGLARSWRWIYVASAVLALYLNVFVGVVQAFQKLPFLRPLAPTQSEPPFLVTQLAVMAIFVVLGIIAVRWFHPISRAPS